MTASIILASRSPYRRALLERLQLPFSCFAPDVDETPKQDETALQLVVRLAERKARAVITSNVAPSDVVISIGSDQVALLEGDILGKPGDHGRAKSQLLRASGKPVLFLTGLCVFNATSGIAQVDVIPYTVVFRRLTEDQVERYLHKEQPYDCAGSFKSEGLGVALFEREMGDDPTALIGLPLIQLTTMLAAEGIHVI